MRKKRVYGFGAGANKSGLIGVFVPREMNSVARMCLLFIYDDGSYHLNASGETFFVSRVESEM
jgi:hypothetical protein